MSAFEPYSPLNTPKPFAEDVWTIDGPEIRMDYGPVTIPFPTRTTVVRLANGDLWVHSPIAPDEQLVSGLAELGEVRHLIAPNSLHYWYMADWLERYPAALSYAVSDLVKKAKRPFRIDCPLGPDAHPDWESEIAWLVVPGTAVSEAVFHVEQARVVVLTDLIENFEPRRVRSFLLRWAVRLAGATGAAPYDLRMTFWPKRGEVRKQVAQMLAWQPEKVVMAHGKPYSENGAAELERAFRWAT